MAVDFVIIDRAASRVNKTDWTIPYIRILIPRLRVDSLQEDLHAQAMRVYAALGDRSGLVNQYQEMKRVFAKEVDMEPLSVTSTLYQRLLGKFRSFYHSLLIEINS